MCKYWLIVALLLLAPLGNQAFAAVPPEHQSKGARKVLTLLGSVGIEDAKIKSLVKDMDTRVKDGYLMLGEERVPGGAFKLHYELAGGLRARQLELRFTPDDSNWRATARTDGVMVSYTHRF
jgi:hypothetical protein